jgi:predicted nucleic acid-binding protein
VATLVFDTSPLSHFARAGRLDALRSVVAGHRCVVTAAVADELANAARHPEITGADWTWLEPVKVDSLALLGVFGAYARILGSGPRDVGEAATLAWAEVNGAIAVVDEAAGRRAAQTRGVEVHGTLWLVTEAVRAEALGDSDAVALVEALRQSGAWLPCTGQEFLAWARQNGLL